MTPPAVVLVEPQLGENIGAAARAMLNGGLTDLRLVKPRDGWPNPRANSMSAGALDKMPPVQVFDSTADALADIKYTYATTARLRDLEKPVMTPADSAAGMRSRSASGQTTAVLFGAERTGLTNDDVALAHAIMHVPLNPVFTSLNLAQAVLLVAYEWCQQGETGALPEKEPPAAHGDFMSLVNRLETELEKHHFFRDDDMRPAMMRNLTTMLTRAEMTDQEVRTFHGIITALTGGKPPRD